MNVNSKTMFLNIGDFYFGSKNIQIKTVLGSCISIVLWHPKSDICSMSHCLLYDRDKEDSQLDFKLGKDVITEILIKTKFRQIHQSEYVTKIFGGGNIVDKQNGLVGNIGSKNSLNILKMLKENGFRIHTSDVGGNYGRKIIFHGDNGDVWRKLTI